MTETEKMLEYNKKFVAEKGYEKFAAGKRPRRKTAILACMDTRLVELLPAALGVKNGDVKMVKNAGGLVRDDYDSAVRSLLIGVVELGVEEIMVVGHTDCGAGGVSAEMMLSDLKKRGVTQETIDGIARSGVDLEAWFRGFSPVEDSVRESVERLRRHPLMPRDVLINGFVIDTETGALTPVE